jgi:hypothetical protein
VEAGRLHGEKALAVEALLFEGRRHGRIDRSTHRGEGDADGEHSHRIAHQARSFDGQSLRDPDDRGRE